MKYIGIIPARYAATRLPGKPLADIAGKSMIRRVFEQAGKASLWHDLLVATDSTEICEHVSAFGKAVMTRGDHPSGSDRCLEAALSLPGEESEEELIVINIQGDEPFVHPDLFTRLGACFQNPDVQIATAIRKTRHRDEIFSEDTVKVVMDHNHKALYFSRYPIPFVRKSNAAEQPGYFVHIGVYAYRLSCLRKLGALRPSMLERAESLEQLRWLENGFPIHLIETSHVSLSIDTYEDLEQARKMAGNISAE